MKPILQLMVFLYTHIAILNAQTAAADNKPSQSETYRSIPKGSNLLGVFQGRTPGAEVAAQLKLPMQSDFGLLKWNLVLYVNAATSGPDSFMLTLIGAGDLVTQQGSPYRQKVLRGMWTVSKGISMAGDGEVYELNFAESSTKLKLLKGDSNVLFILNENNAFRVGDDYCSYTLNRVQLVPAKNKM